MLPIFGMGVGVPQFTTQENAFEAQGNRDFERRQARFNDRFNRSDRRFGSRDSDNEDDRRSRHDSRDRDRERRPRDHDWQSRPQAIQQPRIWDLQPSPIEQQLEQHSRQLQIQQAAAAAAVAVSQPQLLIHNSLIPQPFILGASQAAIDHMTLVNMNLAAVAALQQSEAAPAAAFSEAVQRTQQQPNSTVMIRGLPSHITEQEIREEILNCNLVPKDIRLIRRKDNGASRGFAFIEFSTVQEAARWMDLKQGVLMVKDQFRAVIQYSVPKDVSQSQGKLLQDWLCVHCGGHNFRRRDSCYKCQSSRVEAELPTEGCDEVSGHPTNTLLVRGLSIGCTEEPLLAVLQTRTRLPIRSVRLGRHAGSGASRGLCYLELNSVVDAMHLNKQFEDEPLTVQGRPVLVSYCRLPDQADDVAAVDTSRMSIQELAEYSAKMYAKTPEEYETYLKYYEDYYKTHGTAGVSTGQTQSDSANAAAAVAQTALQRVQKKTPGRQLQQSTAAQERQRQAASTAAAPAVFDENQVYSTPDTSTFQYDETSGYYYDAGTGLYYDSSSQYFYNGTTQAYLYWDATLSRYLPAAAQTSSPADDDKKKPDKHEKVKVAKKIAKDMERWAKTMKKKECRASGNPVLPVDEAHQVERRSADIGYAMFGKRTAEGLMSTGSNGAPVDPAQTAAAAAAAAGSSLVAAYGGESGDEEDPAGADSDKYVDLKKLACLLCKRAFASNEQLNKHLTKSELHRTNLQAAAASTAGTGTSTASSTAAAAAAVYRDRAAERRVKHCDSGPPPVPQQRRHGGPPPPSTASLPAQPVSGVGNKMMQAMGWKDGQGLGRENQGRKDIIQAGRRVASAGLGTVGSKLGGAVAGDTYKDCVKKTMMARFHDMNSS